MKDMNRTSFRQRPIDSAKSLQIISDVNEVIKKEEQNPLNWGNSCGEVPRDPKMVLENEIKKICELFDKKKTIIIPKVEKFEPVVAQAGGNGEGKFSTHTVVYQQAEFIRPKHYIVYSERNRLEPQQKDYEATMYDLNFLKYETNFITVEELEKIISALENDINKGEMIPYERVKEIILTIIPEKKQHVDKIFKYWHTRREDFKKSLLRKYWKDQKYTDKYLGTTFRRREREKMKTRRNKKNENESLQKLKEIRDSTEKYLIYILSFMKQREEWKKNLIITQQFEFESEMNMMKGEKSNLEEKWREFSKSLPKLEEKKNIKVNDPNIIDDYQNSGGKLTQITVKPTLSENKPPSDGRKTKVTKIPKGEKSQPDIKIPKPKVEPNKIEENVLKLRIRYNRDNHLVIDRYIQNEKSFSPFDDSFNANISKMKLFNEDFVYHNDKDANFENLYEEFLKGKYNRLFIFSDSEDDGTAFLSQVKSFQNSHKHFLKQKRTHN